MKKYTLLFFTFISLSLNMNGQQNFQFDPNKLIYGGDIGVGISKNFWNIGLSPQIGYRLSNNFHAGAGFGYRYAKSNRDYYNYSEKIKFRYTENTLSFNLFAHYYPWQNLIFSVKPEIMRTWYKETIGNEEFAVDKFVPAVVIGGGVYMKPFIVQLNYELIQNDYSPYSDTVFFSIGFMF